MTLFVAGGVAGDSEAVLNPPYTATTSNTTLSGFSPQYDVTAQAVEPSGSLVVGVGYASDGGMLLTYPLPLSGSTATPSVTLSLPGVPTGFTFDQSGRLVVSVENCLGCTTEKTPCSSTRSH